MALTLRVPALGESIREATLGAWKRAEGDEVAADEPLVEVESEKATLEVPSPGAGVLRKILRQSGETVAVGDVIAEIDQIGTSRLRATSASASASTNNGGAAARAAPSARKAMTESGLSADDVKGSGRGGRIRSRTLTARCRRAGRPGRPSRRRSPGHPSPSRRRRRGPRSTAPASGWCRCRRCGAVARRLVEAQQTAAILTTFNEVDMTNVLALRERYQERFVKAHGIKLGFMSFFVKAAIDALRAFPAVNGEVRGGDIVYKDHYDIGVAVGGGKGLVVPVVRDADRLSFAEVEAAIADLAVRARDNKLTMKDLEGGPSRSPTAASMDRCCRRRS